jgi:hypothetical protein
LGLPLVAAISAKEIARDETNLMVPDDEYLDRVAFSKLKFASAARHSNVGHISAGGYGLHWRRSVAEVSQKCRGLEDSTRDGRQ